MLVLDSHCDTPMMIMQGRDVGLDNQDAQVDFPKLRRGGVDASFFALYTPAEMQPDRATAYTMEMIARIRDAVAANSGTAALATTPEEAAINKDKGLISIYLGMENGSPIQRSLPLLRLYYDLGVRYLTLTHNGDNEIADSAAEGRRWNGLSPFGREAVAEMNRLGMILDMAHVSDKTFYDVIEISKAPVVSTHSCCRALAGHRRNMTDDMIRKMADGGGVIQINFYPYFLSDKYSPEYPTSVEDVLDHIDHAVKVGGIDHVGIGSDFDGIEVTPAGLENISLIHKVFDGMSVRGYSDDEIEKVAGANFLRVFRDVRSASGH